MTAHTATSATDPRANGNTTPEGLDDAATQAGTTAADQSTEAKDTAEQAVGTKAPLSLEAERFELYQKVKDELASDSLHDEEIQYELARWVELLEQGGQSDEEQEQAKNAPVQRLVVRKAGAAIPALISDRPQLVFARTLRYRTEMELLSRGGWFTRKLVSLSDGDPAVFIGAGVSLTMTAGVIGYALTQLLLLPLLPSIHELLPQDGRMMTVAQAAFLGGGVSILARLREFSCSKIRDFQPLFLFWNALFNPIIAIIFGIFAYSVLTSELIPLKEAVTDLLKSENALWAIGFLSGFSERFTSDIISRSETVFAGPKPS